LQEYISFQYPTSILALVSHQRRIEGLGAMLGYVWCLAFDVPSLFERLPGIEQDILIRRSQVKGYLPDVFFGL